MKSNKSFNQLFFSVFLALILAVAGQSASAAEATGGKSDPYATVNLADLPSDCFYKRAANNWTVLDRTRFIIYESGKRRPFLVEISPPSFNLRSAQTIAFLSNNSRVCGRAGERVLVGDGSESGFQIVAITRLDEARRDELLAIRKEIKAASKNARKDEADPGEDKDNDNDPADSPEASEAGA